MYVCMGKTGVRACEHTDVLRGRTCFQPKTSSVCKVQIKNQEELCPQGPGHVHLSSVSFSSRHPRADIEEPSQLHPGPRQLLKELLRERRRGKSQGWGVPGRDEWDAAGCKSQGPYRPHL